MPTPLKRIARPTLAKYAGLLGPNSIAREALDAYDAIRTTGNRAAIYMGNHDFRVYRAGVQEYPRPTRMED